MIDIHYIAHCAPLVAPSTMLAIVNTESRGKPWTINLNHGYRLKKQPSSYNQAVNWVTYLEKHQYNFDVGIAQVNINNLHRYGYTAVHGLDPCINLNIASKILYTNYNDALKITHNQQLALRMAISKYNSGNNFTGFKNKYVNKVISAHQQHALQNI